MTHPFVAVEANSDGLANRILLELGREPEDTGKTGRKAQKAKMGSLSRVMRVILKDQPVPLDVCLAGPEVHLYAGTHSMMVATS